jgi:EAL domain-containing protein (putative c-di-GMP-specific phosphodiesterase class I)
MIEIRESAAMTDPTRTSRVLYELSRRGFRLAMDDFGAGHSSFGRLAELPCEVLKVDRSFVARLPDDPSAAAMVTAMLELSHGLGMRAVARASRPPSSSSSSSRTAARSGRASCSAGPCRPTRRSL